MTTAHALADRATLDALARQARDAHYEVEQHGRATVAAAIRAGEALIAAKAKVKHGAWLPWLADNFAFTSETANGYMRVAREYSPALNPGATPDLPPTIEAALQLVAGPPRGPREPEPEDTGPLPGQTAIPAADADDDWHDPAPAGTAPTEPRSDGPDHRDEDEVVDAEVVADDEPEGGSGLPGGNRLPGGKSRPKGGKRRHKGGANGDTRGGKRRHEGGQPAAP